MTVVYPRKLNSLSARDILQRVVGDRQLHLVLLNRYRYNEQRSCKDLTDLQEKLNGEPKDLVQDLSRHVADEARHAMWLTDLLVDLGGDIGMPPGMSYIDEFERLLDQDAFMQAGQKEAGIIGALVSINVTEKRGCEYFAAHLHALKSAPETEENLKVRSVLEKIFPEEAVHVRWGNRRLAQIAKQSPNHRQQVEQAKRKYAAIEQAALEISADMMAGAELRNAERLFEIASTLPLWERSQYLMERLPGTLLSGELQKSRIEMAQRAWDQDPQAFVNKFIPMFFQGIDFKKTLASEKQAVSKS